MKNSAILLFIFLMTNQFGYAQNENNNWFFGQNCGVSFNPIITPTGALNTFEGCASISDNLGNLLFYTDGISVINRNNLPMTNGTGLKGSSSSTSSAIIVPKPCSESEYYIFTVDDIVGFNGINYSLVDMDDNSDCFVSSSETGQVVSSSKNIHLPGPTGEKICAVKKSNGLDYWVITTKKNTDNFYVYEVTELGVNPTPIIQSIGPVIRAYGYLKASSTGAYLAMASSQAVGNGTVELYSFNTTTGAIAHTKTIAPGRELVYGVEFSDNEQYLFFSCQDGLPATLNRKEIWTYDVLLSAPSSLPVLLHTSTEITPNNSYSNLGALQISPDKSKILIAKGRTNFLDAIYTPNIGGVYVANDINLGNLCFFGLPAFVSGKIDRCKPLDMVTYRNAVPDLFTASNKLEIITDGITGFDKEYGDVDNDGDVDVLFTKSSVLYYFENTQGYCVDPLYPNASISLNIPNCYSFRLYDWESDGDNDLIVHGSPNGKDGVFLYRYNSTSGAFQTVPTMLLDGIIDYPYEAQQLIEVGDLNNDNLPDILISGQGNIFGTAYFENTGTGLVLTAPQIYSGSQISNPFITEDGGSYPCPELYDTDCANGLDLLISDPLTGPGSPSNPSGIYGGGRVAYYKNLGGVTTATPPNFTSTALFNQFGFDDLNNDDLRCDWVITRIVDFYNDKCPIAISYNPCNDEIYFYNQQNCVCSDQNFTVSVDDIIADELSINVFPNPANDIINIVAEDGMAIQSFSIYSISGRLVRTEKYYKQEINVSELNTGIYLLNIQTRGGHISKKIIIE